MRVIRGLSFAACLGALSLTASGRGLPGPDKVVAADGTGDFKTIQAAVASITPTNRERTVIFIRNGTYHEKIRVDAPFVTLRGESRRGTRVEFSQLNDDYTQNPDPIGRAVVNLNHADDFVLENLTVENTAGVVGPHAFTFFGTGDRTVILNCDVLSAGADTVSPWLGDRGRYYLAHCRFCGSVDFVCPRGWCYAEDCSFYEMKSGSASVWHDGHLDKDMKFVLRDCRFDGTNGWVLGRHHMDAQFYFLDCAFASNLADKPVARVIYPNDPQRNATLDRSNLWGERVYFYGCHRKGGDYSWLQDNLATASGSPAPKQITAAWTFAGKWNPERNDGPQIRSVNPGQHGIDLTFSESVTVKGAPRLALKGGSTANYSSGSGTEILHFEMARNGGADVKSVDLNGGAIIASEAGVSLRPAELRLPRGGNPAKSTAP